MEKWEYQNKSCYLENCVVREPCKQRTACLKMVSIWNYQISSSILTILAINYEILNAVEVSVSFDKGLGGSIWNALPSIFFCSTIYGIKIFLKHHQTSGKHALPSKCLALVKKCHYVWLDQNFDPSF